METVNLNKEEMGYIKNLAKRFAEKWTLDIMIALANGNNAIGFNEMMRELDGISAAVLSNRLKDLQEGGYVKREVQSGPPARTFYRLTEKGRDFIKVAYFVVHRRGKPESEVDEYYKRNLSGITL